MAIFPRKTSSLKRKEGLSLTEVMVVVVIIAILILVAIWSYRLQLLKGRDSRRKADLNRLEKVFEDYYNDHDCYPERINQLVPDYLSEFLVDPVTQEPYEWSTDGCDVFRIYAKLDNEKDPAIAEVGCGSGCGPGAGTDEGQCIYNYGVCSPNTELENCGWCPNSCQGGICNKLDKAKWDCRQWFCDPYCGGDETEPNGFCNPAKYDQKYWCTQKIE